MAHFKQPQKQRKSSGTNTSRGGRNRATSRVSSARSDITSGSRYSTASRRTSTASSQGQTNHRVTAHLPPPRSERSASVATTRTFVGDDRSVAATEQSQDDFQPDEDTLSEVIMAVNMLTNGTVGCAYYVARDEKLYFMEDVRMGGADVVDACKYAALALQLLANVQQ